MPATGPASTPVSTARRGWWACAYHDVEATAAVMLQQPAGCLRRIRRAVPPSWPGLSGPSPPARAATDGPDRPGHDEGTTPGHDGSGMARAAAYSLMVPMTMPPRVG